MRTVIEWLILAVIGALWGLWNMPPPDKDEKKEQQEKPG
jgi:hypothetical protein